MAKSIFGKLCSQVRMEVFSLLENIEACKFDPEKIGSVINNDIKKSPTLSLAAEAIFSQNIIMMGIKDNEMNQVLI